MARPPKKTLDFFMHDSGARGDRKIKGLRRRHGNDGYATYFILLEMICQEEGMRLTLAHSLDTETAIEETGTRDQAHLHAIVQTCADIGLFDKQLWESERIVFSHGLYKRYVARLEERKADANRKQRKREEQALQARIDEVTQNEIQIQTPEPKAETEPYSHPDPKHPELSESYPTGQLTGPAEKPVRKKAPVIVDRFAMQFQQQPWRPGGKLDADFCEFVGKAISFDGDKESMHPKQKGRGHILNLEKTGSIQDLEKLEGYWDDYQESLKNPVQESSSIVDRLMAYQQRNSHAQI